MPVGKGNKGNQIFQMAVVRPGKMIIINIVEVLKVGAAISIKISGGGSDHGCSLYGGKRWVCK